jgi:hypothetical protein
VPIPPGCSNEARSNIKRFPPQKDDNGRHFLGHSIDWVFENEHFGSPADWRVKYFKRKGGRGNDLVSSRW